MGMLVTTTLISRCARGGTMCLYMRSHGTCLPLLDSTESGIEARFWMPSGKFDYHPVTAFLRPP
uniref:Uncharacterized protein n=1 Tax=Aegilops tauschii subsp. strangulata TaxID=200361 RepID=A0A453JIL6_AEGTS